MLRQKNRISWLLKLGVIASPLGRGNLACRQDCFVAEPVLSLSEGLLAMTRDFYVSAGNSRRYFDPGLERHGRHYKYTVIFLLMACSLGLPMGTLPGSPACAAEAQKEQTEGGWLSQQLSRFRTYPHLDRAYRLIDDDRLLEAREELERSLVSAPQDMSVWMTYVIVLFRLQEYEDVIEHTDVVLKDQPDFVTALRYQGMAYAHLEQPEQAMESFQKIADIAATQGEDWTYALNMMIDLCIRQAQWSRALETLETLAEFDDDFGLYYRRGLVLAGLDRREDVRKAYTKAYGLAQNAQERVMTLKAMGDFYLQGRDWHKAAQALDSALELEPADPELLRARAKVAEQQNDYPEAITHLKAVLKITSNRHDREWLANVLYANKDYSLAKAEYSLTLEEILDPEDLARVYLARGYTALKLKEFNAAAEDFGLAAQQLLTREALLARAMALEKAGQRQPTIASFEAALEHFPDADIHFRLGMFLSGLGQQQKAVQHLQAARAEGDLLERDKLTVHKQLGYLYYDLGDYAQARAAMADAAQLDPRDAAIPTALGEISMKQQAFGDAVQFFRQSLDIQENLSRWRMLAEAHAKNGDWDEALRINRSLLELRLPEHVKGRIAEKLSAVNSQKGDFDLAAHRYREAIVAGQHHWSNRQGLGLSL